MTNHTEHTRRIAKNTLMLYFRMFFMMLLGLFTSRIVLEALGETDYGIYNVVGGVVALFTMVSGSLTTAVTRFITFELGKNDDQQKNKVYSVSVIVMFILSLIVVILVEPVGLWFIEHKMTIDPIRIPAAEWVLHFSIFTFVVNLMSIPQTASITAHEKMSAYAYIGILDGMLRFAVAIAIMRSNGDRLVLYAMLMAASVMIVRMAYGKYCSRHFEECHFRFVFDKPLLKEMFSFAGWNFIGSASGVLRDQGTNIMVNLFFGPMMNAARGVALQLNNTVLGFVNNFMIAVNPQITKSYASGDHENMFSLVRKSARFSYYLLFILVLPILFNTEFLMGLWLKEVPAHAVSFVRLFLIFSLSEVLSNPLITTMLATGNIRNYQLLVGGLQLLNLPVSYILLNKSFAPEVTVLVAIVISQVCLMARLFMLKRMVNFPSGVYFYRVYLNVLTVTFVSIPLPLIVSAELTGGWNALIISASVCVISAALSVIIFGCTRDERKRVWHIILGKIHGKSRG